MKKRSPAKKATAKKPAAASARPAKSSAKKPAPPTRPAKTAASSAAPGRDDSARRAARYTPQEVVPGTGWRPFRYPPQ